MKNVNWSSQSETRNEVLPGVMLLNDISVCVSMRMPPPACVCVCIVTVSDMFGYDLGIASGAFTVL